MSLEGKLVDLNLPDIFQILSLSKRSGILTLLRKEGTARLVFRSGNIVFASSDNKNRLGYTLVTKGVITTEELEEALKIQSRSGGSKPLGTLLIDLELITKEALEEEIKQHICVVVSGLLTWKSGSFHFELGELVEQDDQKVPLKEGISTDFILLESARIRDEEEAGKERMGVLGNVSSGDTLASLEEGELKAESRQSGLDEMKILTSMIAEISGPSSRSEITLMVLRFASEIMNRAAIFLVRKTDIVGLGQFGIEFTENIESDSQIRSVSVELAADSKFKHVIDNQESFTGKLDKDDINEQFTSQLGGGWPGEVFLAPLIADGRVVALLYGDNLPAKRKIGRTEALEAFIRVAGVSLGKTLLERKLRDKKAKTA